MLCARHLCLVFVRAMSERLVQANGATAPFAGRTSRSVVSRLRCAMAALVLAGACIADLQARPFVIGSIANAPSTETTLYYPLAAYLGRNLTEFGFSSGKVTVAQDIPGLINLFNAGLIDFYIDSPYALLAVSQASGTKVILRRWKNGRPDYCSIIVVRKESGITGLADLNGKLIAFENDFSTSGYLLPKLALQASGLSLSEYHDGSDHLGATSIGYIFSRDEENTLVWVLRGRVSAGAIGTHEYERFRPAERDQLHIIYQTAPIPRQLVSVKKDTSAPRTARIRSLLIELENAEAGRKLMANLEDTTRFDDIPADAEQSLAPIRAHLSRSVALTER
ncbi:MAG: phosphate/phosphite/phosphonate ABC transporter substrate-binding protein [Betaproteobacteria bacterium]|nr:phosphate/phosphite/phosphonate ABC transporter substrate-binding protein [Betaproteobacteria bacterium]